jgi:malate synthase
MSIHLPTGVTVTGRPIPAAQAILSDDAVHFVARLQREFGARRAGLLAARRARQLALDAGESPDFLTATLPVRADSSWRVAAIPSDLQRRHVEITGPTDRKMMIHALNSGADVFMADLEDANSPTWTNMVEGQLNLRDAATGGISLPGPDGRVLRLHEHPATLMVRPRGWHLEERHVQVDGQAVSASLFDFGLAFFHTSHALLARGSGPYFYLPKLESHREARLWNDVFCFAEDALHIPRGTLKCTVLIETILAAFEMEEILFELRDHITGLNAGRWDYMFSIIKKFRAHADVVLPDRAQVTMTVPFMRAYTELLVRTCHARGAHAMGGMSAFVPSRRDAAVNATALARVREDKQREARDGFDGTWVAHPDLVPVAQAEFTRALGDRPHQKERLRYDVRVGRDELLDFRVPQGTISEAGLRNNIAVGLQYLAAWLRGTGAVAIYNLMEDAATAEIARAQVWQWLHRPGSRLVDGRPVSEELCGALLAAERMQLESMSADGAALGQAAELFAGLITAPQCPEFLTLVAYDHLD